MEANFQIFLILLGVLAAIALLARRLDIAPAILLLATGVGLAFVPGRPRIELPPDLVLLVVLPPLMVMPLMWTVPYRMWKTRSRKPATVPIVTRPLPRIVTSPRMSRSPVALESSFPLSLRVKT